MPRRCDRHCASVSTERPVMAATSSAVKSLPLGACGCSSFTIFGALAIQIVSSQAGAKTPSDFCLRNGLHCSQLEGCLSWDKFKWFCFTGSSIPAVPVEPSARFQIVVSSR